MLTIKNILIQDKNGTSQEITHNFQVNMADTFISGCMNDNGTVKWSIEIKGDKFDLGYDVVEPRLYIEDYPWGITSLDEIAQKSIHIPDGATFCDNMILPGGKLCCIYLSSHHFLDNNELVFKRTAPGLFDLNWKSTAKTGVGNLEIQVQTTICFDNIYLGEKSIEEVKDIIKFDLTDLQFVKDERRGVLNLVLKP